MQQTQPTTPKTFLKRISIIHFAMFIAPVGLALMMYYEITKTKLEINDTGNMFLYIVPIAALLSIFLGNHFFNKQINIAKTKDTLLEKLNIYQTGSIIKFSMLEGAALLGTLAFKEGGNLFYLTISGILIMYLALQRPTKFSVENALNLTLEQQSQFNNPNEILV